MKDDQIALMGYAIEKFLLDSKMSAAKPKDLMETLIKKGFFKKDHREGLPLRNILRDLDENNKLYLLPQVDVLRGNKNRKWFFNRVES